MVKNETEPKKLPIWAIKLITRLDELANSLEMNIRLNEIHDKNINDV